MFSYLNHFIGMDLCSSTALLDLFCARQQIKMESKRDCVICLELGDLLFWQFSVKNVS